MGRGRGHDAKPFRWSGHALEALVDRGIDRAEVERALAEPERVVSDPPGREVWMRRYVDARLGQEMLIRAVVEEERDERVVVTVYATSRIGKYLGGRRS